MWTTVLAYIVGWYVCAISLSVYNKWMFDPINGLGVEYPVLLTAFHQTTLWVLSALYIVIHEKLNPASAQHRKSPVVQNHNNDWKFYMKYIIPTAVATAGDIGFSNASFKFVPLTVYTIIKSSSIAFVLLFSCIFKLEKFHWKLGVIVLVMFFGVVMMVYRPNDGSSDNDQTQALIIFGSLLVLASSCLSGLRWVYTQLILKKTVSLTVPIRDEENNNNSNNNTNQNDEYPVEKSDEKPHPIYTIHQLAPIMGATLIITSLIIERPLPGIFKSNLFKVEFNSNKETNFGSISRGIFLMILPGIDVFVLTFCEFGILQLTKVLTLSIAGIVKEVLTILTGMIFLHERISGVYNWIGMTIVLLDVVYYNHFRYRQKQENEYIKLSSVESTRSVDKSESTRASIEPYSAVTDFTLQEFEMDTLSMTLSHTSDGPTGNHSLRSIGDIGLNNK
ncbi:similar to Saccharomyces cerevisiae YML038C YMD8 Putative nucleotide sugar transporter, has similarity to Vrg4p [Maudiozyma barnettii]|uniref:Similar to Saccharomyces cerevisiae YML038C YMD8 Putative nucleotide sugar transporter, has similarity to Vrg4p n=1 Tax=Maudiozyma barnettii TaxID=61262 RepID=A0A8H2ZJA0_9SACH|nr:Ymd8p [Kazachstania barnettii]CAB4256322.1 similar to Saccharomyces cerevisiae YML038C YMD8 Putative nucleotide sugar transporter, has similarity to Vrg4p [Kazachstania barnettii]CAD1784931.1 similar to Saccharomyces cerevisiae YML038C YMD8 Putative nucleotide sugar transporter, has similarity to Vrg4p [Kazachstania barnettii]